jgi:histidinol dehydrogenase
MPMKIINASDFDFKPRTQIYDHDTIELVRGILDDIQNTSLSAVKDYAVKFGDIAEEQDIVIADSELESAYNNLPKDEQELLTRTANRIKAFATAQRQSIQDLKFSIDGGFAGHNVMPMEVAGCYAPGGRFPLPSSVLMTVIPAKVAGVKTICLASPKPTQHTLAAAYVAGADIMLRIGGAQAIGAMAYGINGIIPNADVIVGPGNRYVTAAKQIVSGHVSIDMLAGPSELAILADETAEPKILAADLLAQAEHDTDAWPVLICTSQSIIDQTMVEIEQELKTLSTASTASVSIAKGLAIYAKDIDGGLKILNHLASEHVEIICKNSKEVAKRVEHAGGLFIGNASAEVIGDYGAGPNHTLPTGGTARYKAGLSVFNFIRMTTWIDIDEPEKAQQLYEDAEKLGSIEGLEAHARAASLRRT